MNQPYRTLLGARSWRNQMLSTTCYEETDVSVTSSSRYTAYLTTLSNLFENARSRVSGFRFAK